MIGLDLPAAFDTVDHSLLIDRLQSEFGVTNTPLDWLRSYLSDREQFVKIGQHQSDAVPLDVGCCVVMLKTIRYCNERTTCLGVYDL